MESESKTRKPLVMKKESAGRKILTILISILFVVAALLLVNLHYRNYIDTETQNALPLGAQTGSIGGYRYSTAADDWYRNFVENTLNLKINKN